MKYIILNLFLTLSTQLMAVPWIQILPDPNRIYNSVGSCDFYLLLEQQVQCDSRFRPLHQPSPYSNNSSDYLVDFGNKYCLKFTRLAAKTYSQKLQQWINKTLLCLQISLLNPTPLFGSCRQLEIYAFDFHAQCYVDSGFCRLPLADKKQIVDTIPTKELFKNTHQVFSTLRGCL